MPIWRYIRLPEIGTMILTGAILAISGKRSITRTEETPDGVQTCRIAMTIMTVSAAFIHVCCQR